MSGFDFNSASDQRAAILQNAAGMCADWQTVLSAVRQEMLVRQWSAGDIMPDGDLHRFSTDANRRGDTAGWYIAHSDGVPCVMFGDWRTGEVETVTGLDPELQKTGIPLRVITQRELDEHRAWIETQKKRRETERKTEDQKAREKAYRLYEAAKDVSLADAEKLPYFVKKGIRNAPGARFTENGTILIPMYDETGAPAGIQFIYPDGAKKFISGMAVKSRFGWIVGQGACIYVCEGYATACSVHAATAALSPSLSLAAISAQWRKSSADASRTRSLFSAPTTTSGRRTPVVTPSIQASTPPGRRPLKSTARSSSPSSHRSTGTRRILTT